MSSFEKFAEQAILSNRLMTIPTVPCPAYLSSCNIKEESLLSFLNMRHSDLPPAYWTLTDETKKWIYLEFYIVRPALDGYYKPEMMIGIHREVIKEKLDTVLDELVAARLNTSNVTPEIIAVHLPSGDPEELSLVYSESDEY